MVLLFGVSDSDNDEANNIEDDISHFAHVRVVYFL
jgi:hypothetical protein